MLFIFQGLVCLEYDLRVGPHKTSRIVEEQATCHSDEAIPLHYEPLARSPTTHSRRPTVGGEGQRSDELQMTSISVESEDQQTGHTWHKLSKGLLLRKAALTFAAITKTNMNKSEYTESFKYLKLAMYCFGKLFHIHITRSW